MVVQEGLFTIVYGFACFFLLPNSPTSSRFLTDEEKKQITRALHNDGIVLQHEHDSSYTLAESFKTFLRPHVLLVGLAGFFNGKCPCNPRFSCTTRLLGTLGVTVGGLGL